MLASNIHVNTKNNQENQKTSHWLFSIGTTAHSQDPFYPTIEIGFGYQSKFEEDKYFQTQRLELMGGASLDGNYTTWAIPKFSALHYFNTQGNMRYYYLVGASIHGYTYTYKLKEIREFTVQYSYKDYEGNDIIKDYTDYRENEGQLSIAANVGIGVEIGKLYGTINNFQLSLDQPTLFFGKKRDTNSFKPFLKATYIVGF